MPDKSTPVLKKGKPIKYVPKGSTKEIEQAKQTWLIEYYFNGKRYRVTEGINKIKDPKEKKTEAEDRLKTLKEDLADGMNPENPDEYYQNLHKINLTLPEAISVFTQYHYQILSRKKSIQSYLSKLNALRI